MVDCPHVEPVPSLEQLIQKCIGGDYSSLQLVKGFSAAGDVLNSLNSRSGCSNCGGVEQYASLHFALGLNAGLVIEDVAGYWCEQCESATLPHSGADLRARLLDLNFKAAPNFVPSFLYDSASHPRSIQLEVTTYCNLKCHYCSHRLLTEKSHLAPNEFINRMRNIDWEQVQNVDLTGLGEPTLHPQLDYLIREIRQRSEQTEIRLVTNGTVISPERFNELSRAGLTSLAFSIDSLDPERFARSRGGAKLGVVLRNLEAAADLRMQSTFDFPRLRIKAVLLDEPYGEAERLLSYSARLGLDMPQFSCLDKRSNATTLYQESWLSHDWTERNGDAFSHWVARRWEELVPSAKSEIRERRNLPYVNPILTDGEDVCRWAIDAVFITENGDCLSCCEQMIDLPRKVWAKLQDVQLGELWTNELFWGYRLPLALGRLPQGCIGCPQAPLHAKAFER